MTNRTYTQKDGTIWEWEETEQLVKNLKEYYNLVESNKNK